MKRKNNLAKLKKSEDALFSNEFEYYFNNVRGNTIRACAYAWRCCQKEFSRLRKFDGAKP